MNKTQKLIGSKETIDELTKLMKNCEKAREHLVWTDNNKILLPAQKVLDAIQLWAEESATLFTFLKGLTISSVADLGTAPTEEKA